MADAQKRVEQELVGLPVGVAWCRAQNNKGELEEHTIRLEASKISVAGKKEREQWIEEIKKRMLKIDKTLRLITDVEAEIAQRQAKLKQPAQPQLFIVDVPQPQEPELPKTEGKRQRITKHPPAQPHQPVQPAPTSDAHLEQAEVVITRKRYEEEIRRGLLDPSLGYGEWYKQEIKKLLK